MADVRAHAPRPSFSRPRTWAALALLALVSSSCSSCKKGSDKPDAAAGPTIVKDEELGFELELLPDWVLVRASSPDAGAPPTVDAGPRATPHHEVLERLAEARRAPPRGKTYLVQPKLVVSAEPTTVPDLETLLRTTANDLRGIERAGARIGRSAQATRLFGDVEVGDLEIAYALGDPKASPREIVQRTLVALRTRPDGTSAAWSLTVTYLAEDGEAVIADVQQMLSTLRFTARAASPDGGSR